MSAATESTSATSTSNGVEEDTTTTGSLLKQTLLSIDEVFVYKIPPLRAHGGHRAEDWDLANPLQTCGFQVERRNNDLYLIFTTENHTKIFALSKYIPHTNSVEPVVDSSRYFVTQLVSDTKSNSSGRHVWIGFGFRNRDAAVDLLGVLQNFSKSIDRELEAKKKVDQAQTKLSQTKLHDGDKMHIVFGSKEKSKIVHNTDGESDDNSNSNSPDRKKKSSSSGGTGAGAFLLKKPPGYHQQEESNIFKIDTTKVKLPPTPPTSTGVPKSSQDSAAAVADALGDSTDDDLDDDNDDGDEDDEWNDFQGA